MRFEGTSNPFISQYNRLKASDAIDSVRTATVRASDSITRCGDVVESDHRDVLGNPLAQTVGPMQHPQGDDVAGAKTSCGGIGVFQQFGVTFVTAFEVVRTGHDERFVEWDGCFGQGLAVPSELFQIRNVVRVALRVPRR